MPADPRVLFKDVPRGDSGAFRGCPSDAPDGGAEMSSPPGAPPSGRGAARMESGVVDAFSRAPRPAPPVDLPRAEGYALERLVAEGGMGLVFAARELRSGTRVALKTPRASLASDAGVLGRFRREVGFARRIESPFVASALDDGELEDGRPFYTMPLYEGVTLGAMTRASGGLELGRAVSLVLDLLEGLEAIHAAGVVHRDLQPDNVIVTREKDGREAARILDFGFAHEPGVDRGDGVSPESPGALVGTLRFMSPEQATRARAITARSDLFAAALLLYYAASGKLPFRGRDDVDVVVAIVRQAPVPLRRERRDVPRALDELLLRALAKHPEARFESAAEMRRALASIGAPASAA